MGCRHMSTEPGDDQVRLVVVDDSEPVHQGLVASLGAAPDLAVVGAAGSIAEATDLVSAVGPDVVVLDVRLPDGSGLDLCRHLTVTMPAVRCVLHTGSIRAAEADAATDAGAVAVVLKSLSGTELLDAIRRAGWR